MPKSVKNKAASVRQRLLDKSKQTGESFQLLAERYALERMLYRLSCSVHAQSFILKGGMLIAIWTGQPYRSTRDADMLVFGESEPEHLVNVFRELCALDVDDDGMIFQQDSITHEPIKEDQEYGGTRLNLSAHLGNMKVPVQFDIGFGDAVTPQAEWQKYPPILPDSPALTIRIYPKETVVAEKFDTIVQRGLANSRMKDYYDIFFLQKTFEFRGEYLVQAIASTFDRRGTEIPIDVPEGLSLTFFTDSMKIRQWQAFVRKNISRQPQYTLQEVVEALQTFLMPPAKAAGQKQEWQEVWSPGSGWTAIEIAS